MATMVSPIVTIARPRSVSDYRAGRGANKPARKRSAGRVASQPADKRAGATTNQCAACDPIRCRMTCCSGFLTSGPPAHTCPSAIRRADRTLLWLNIFFFMFVSLLPFSTSVLNAFSEAFIAPLFFGANLAIIGWILFLQWHYANSQPDMLADFVSGEYRRTVKSRMLIVPVATTLTVLICFWSVGISLAIYLLLLPLYMLPGNLSGAKSHSFKTAP